jgi:hypothetical protein
MPKVLHPGIVVLGMPRSGTTLLRRLFDGHSNICAPGETFLLRAAARFLESEEIAYGIDYGVLGGLKAMGFAEAAILERLRGLAFGYYEELARREGKSRWAAKTAVDSFHVDGIERLCGDHAFFICVVRHGLDVVCSLKEFSDELQGYIAELHPYVQRYPRPLEAFAHAWVDVTRNLLAFVARRPENAICCRYEDLVRQPQETLERLFAFIGEPIGSDLLAQAFEKKLVAGLGDWKTYATREINRDSLDRWRRLPSETLARLGPVVNSTLEAAGYAPVECGPGLSRDDAMRLYELAMMFKSVRANGDEAPAATGTGR